MSNGFHQRPGAVLWDMDGTLIDQTEPIIRCYSRVVAECGSAEPDPDVIRRSLGGPLPSTMALLVPASQVDTACLRFREIFPSMMFDGLIVLPGAVEVLRHFNNASIPQAIFTNKHGETARSVCTHCGFDDYVSLCIGTLDTEWTKPDPALTHHVMDQIGARNAETVLIGDSPTDAETAALAGIGFLGVATGAHTKEELFEAGAFLSLDSLESLFEKTGWR